MVLTETEVLMTSFQRIRAKAISDMLAHYQELQEKVFGHELHDGFYLNACEQQFDKTFTFICYQWCERRLLNQQKSIPAENIQLLNQLEVDMTEAALIRIGISQATAEEIASSFI